MAVWRCGDATVEWGQAENRRVQKRIELNGDRVGDASIFKIASIIDFFHKFLIIYRRKSW